MGKFGVLSGKPLFREVQSDYTPARTSVEVDVDTGIIHAGVDSDAYVMREFAGGAAIGTNRFVTWRGYQREEDFLELFDHCLDARIVGPSSLRLKFCNSSVLDGISVSEDANGGAVLILVPTIHAMHVFAFPHPARVAFDREGQHSSPGLFQDVNPENFAPQQLAAINVPQGDQPYAACSSYNRSSREAMFAVAYKSGPIHVLCLPMLGSPRYTILGETSSVFSKFTSLWRLGSGGLTHEEPAFSARAVCFLPPLPETDSPVLAAVCRDRMVRFYDVNRREVVSTVPIFEKSTDRAIPQLEDQKVMIAVICDARGALDKLVVSISLHQSPPGSMPSVHTITVLQKWLPYPQLKPAFTRSVIMPHTASAETSSLQYVYRDLDYNCPTPVEVKKPRNPVVLIDLKAIGDQVLCLTQSDGVLIFDMSLNQENHWFPVKRSEEPPLNPQEDDANANIMNEDSGNGGFVKGEDFLDAPTDLRGRIRRILSRPGLFSAKHFQQACETMHMNRIEKPPSSERLSDWIEYVTNVLDEKCEEEYGGSSVLEAFDSSARLRGVDVPKSKMLSGLFDFNFAEDSKNEMDVDQDLIDMEEAEMENEIDNIRGAVDAVWSEFYRCVFEFRHADCKPLGLVVDCETGLKAVVKSHAASVAFLRGMTVAEEIYVVADEARTFKESSDKPDLEEVETTIGTWIPSGPRVPEAIMNFFGKMYASIIASRGAVFEEVKRYQEVGYEGFFLAFSNGMGEIEGLPENAQVQELRGLDLAIKMLFEWEQNDILNGLDKDSAFKEFLKVAEINPSEKDTLNERRPFAAASAGLMKAQHGGQMFSNGTSWMAGPEGVGVLLASLRQSVEARAALCAVTPIVDLLVHVQVRSRLPSTVVGHGPNSGVKLFAMERAYAIAEGEVIMDTGDGGPYSGIGSVAHTQPEGSWEVACRKVDVHAATYGKLLQLAVTPKHEDEPVEGSNASNTVVKRTCSDMNNTTLRYGGDQDASRSRTIRDPGEFVDSSSRVIGFVLEEFIGARARDAWLTASAPSPVPLPPCTNFAWEWGVGAFIVHAVKYMWPGGKDDSLLLRHIVQIGNHSEFLSFARTAIEHNGRNVAIWRFVALRGANPKSFPVEALVEAAFSIARDAHKAHPNLLKALDWPTVEKVKADGSGEKLTKEQLVMFAKEAKKQRQQQKQRKSLVDPTTSRKKKSSLQTYRLVTAHRMQTLFTFYRELNLNLGRGDVVPRCSDVRLAFSQLASHMTFAEFEARYDSLLRTQTFSYELQLKDFGGCFRLLKERRLECIAKLESQGLPCKPSMLLSDTRMWARCLIMAIFRVGCHELLLDDFSFDDRDPMLFEVFCQLLESAADGHVGGDNYYYPVLERLYLKKRYFTRAAWVQYTYGARLEEAGLLDRGCQCFESALMSLEMAEEEPPMEDGKTEVDFCIRFPGNQWRFFKKTDVAKRVALSRAQLQLKSFVVANVGPEEGERVLCQGTPEVEKFTDGYVLKLAATLCEYGLFVPAMSLCRAWGHPWDRVCQSFAEKMLGFLQNAPKVSPPWLSANVQLIEEPDVKALFVEKTGALVEHSLPGGLKKNSQGRVFASANAMRAISRIRDTGFNNVTRRVWYLLDYLTMPDSKRLRLPNMAKKDEEEEETGEPKEEGGTKDEEEDVDVAVLARMEVFAKRLLEAQHILPDYFVRILKKKRCLTLFGLHYDTNHLTECCDLILTYLHTITAGGDPIGKYHASPEEFGLEGYLGDTNVRLQFLVPYAVIEGVLDALKDLAPTEPVAQEKLDEILDMLSKLELTQQRFKKQTVRVPQRFPPLSSFIMNTR